MNDDLPIKKIERWKVVPSSDNTTSLVGVVDGVATQTSPIQFARPGAVRTKNTQYLLGEKLVGVWEIQLEMRRPSQAENLRRMGVL